MAKLRVAVIGAGNGGQTMAGHLGMIGHRVRLYNRTASKLGPIQKCGGIKLTEAVHGFGKIEMASERIGDVVDDAEVIMITTTADAHSQIALMLTPYLKDQQIVVLNPGRTLGALEVKKIFNSKIPEKKIFVAEAQSLVYACRMDGPGSVRVIGVKDKVLLSAWPQSDLSLVLEKLHHLYPCFVPVESILITGLENFGAIFHTAIVLFNAAAIERGDSFYFYNDITPQIAMFLKNLDEERVKIGAAYGFKLHTCEEWVSFAYKNVEGNDLYSKMRNNPAYFKILAPKHIRSRLLTEDIPTGILPMIELGKVAGVELPLMNSVFNIGQALLEENFLVAGRTLANLGLEGKSVSDILEYLK